MAIYHCSLRVFSRAEGHSAVAAAAYRAGAMLKDERTSRIHRYEKRHGVKNAFILAPKSAPENFLSRPFLWNAAEASENRKNSRVAREVILALPHELSDTEREALSRDVALYLIERYRVAVDVAVLDKEQTRSTFNDEIKALNEKRAAFGDKPLLEQITQLDRLMERLDKRVEKLERLETKTSLPAIVKKAIISAAKLAADLLVNRKEARAAIKLTAEEKQTRKERQTTRYGRSYRAGLHHQIKEMKQNMVIVEAKKEDFRRYKSFVDKIDKELLKHPPSITTRFKEQNPPPSRQVTDKEVNFKLHLKAEMIRSHIPEQYRAPSLLKSDRKTLTNSTAINQILQTKNEPIRIEKPSLTKLQTLEKRESANLADRKSWFIPASDKVRPLQIAIMLMGCVISIVTTISLLLIFLKPVFQEVNQSCFLLFRKALFLPLSTALNAHPAPNFRGEVHLDSGKLRLN